MPVSRERLEQILDEVDSYIGRQDWVGLNALLAMQDTEHMQPEELCAYARFSAPARQKLSQWEAFCREGRYMTSRRGWNVHEVNGLFYGLPE